jgi:hypothetical protein
VGNHAIKFENNNIKTAKELKMDAKPRFKVVKESAKKWFSSVYFDKHVSSFQLKQR